jgi:3-hydroxybutyryl-CoA dehydrogenase
MLNEGIRCLDEQVASLKNVDTAMKVGAGMPKGPLEWADEMGLDQLLASLTSFKEKYGERFLSSPLLKRKISAGHLGKKKGVGFYRY